MKIINNKIVCITKFRREAAYASSHFFAILSLIFYIKKYPWYTVLGLFGQYILTISIWSPNYSLLLLCSDRLLAIVNIAIIGNEHIIQGSSIIIFGPFVVIGILFKIIDWRIKPDQYYPVSLAYLLWHLNMFISNVLALTYSKL